MTRHHLVHGRFAALAAVALLAGLWPAVDAAAGQPDAAGTEAMRARVLERFTIAPVAGGIALVPLPDAGIEGVGSVAIVDGTIAIDGAPVSGRELTERLPEDAALMVQLSYLDDAELRALVEAPRPGAATATPPVLPVPRARRSPRPRSRDIVRFGGNVTVAAGEQVDGSVVVFGGNARIDGDVRGDVVVFGGVLRLGPGADVDGTVAAVGTRLLRAPGARVGGDVVDIGPDMLRFRFGDFALPGRRLFQPSVRRFLGIVTTGLRLGLLIIVGWLFFAVAGGPVHRIASRAGTEPLKAGAVGVLVELLFLPVLVMVSILLAVSVVGIPLLALVPVAVLALVIVLLIGFTAVALRVGRWMGARLGAAHVDGYAAVALGTLALLSLALLARLVFMAGGLAAGIGGMLLVLGFCVEYAAWTVGLGAAVLVRFAPLRELPPAAGVPIAPPAGPPAPPPAGSPEPPADPPPATTEPAPPAGGE